MKKPTLITLLTACIFTLSSCGEMPAPAGGSTPPGTPGPGNTTTYPPIVNPACLMEFPSTETALCKNPDGSEIAIDAFERKVTQYINELREFGTLDGKIFNEKGVRILDGTCAEGLYVRDHQGGLPAFTREAHVHHAALKHAEYLSVNRISSGEDIPNPHSETPGMPLFVDPKPRDRMYKAGVNFGKLPWAAFTTGEILTSGTWVTEADNSPLFTVKAFLYSPGHCALMLKNKPGYMGVGFANIDGFGALNVDFIYGLKSLQDH